MPGKTLPAVPAPGFPAVDKANTTHLTVVDGEGNMVSLTQTLGSWYGSGVVAADTGVLFSNQMRHLHTEPNSPSKLGPGRRPGSKQSPLIVLKDGEPVMAIGTPGRDGIWQRLAQVLVNVIDFGMDVRTAVAAPRMIYGGYQETGTEIPPVFDVEDRIPEATIAALRGRGYTVEVIPSDEGSVNGVRRDLATGFLFGGADPRREGPWWARPRPSTPWRGRPAAVVDGGETPQQFLRASARTRAASPASRGRPWGLPSARRPHDRARSGPTCTAAKASSSRSNTTAGPRCSLRACPGPSPRIPPERVAAQEAIPP